MKREIVEHVAICDSCQRIKAVRPGDPAPCPGVASRAPGARSVFARTRL
jgi:hypothetical protein